MAIPRPPDDQPGGQSLRCRRVAEAIKETASTIITQELADPRLGFVTVTGVKVSPDLREAKVFVSIMGEQADRSKTMKALEHAAGFIKRRCGDSLKLRFTPQIKFEFDPSVDKAARLSELLYSDSKDQPEKLEPMDETEAE